MDSERGRVYYTRARDTANRPCATALIVVFLALHITMLVIGLVKKDECPVQERIPVYLMIAGATGIVSKLLLLLNRKCNTCFIDLLVSIITLFEIVWLVIGSVWVYSIYEPNYSDRDHTKYCSKSAYLMSFWLITVNWAFWIVTTILSCCCCCCFSRDCFQLK